MFTEVKFRGFGQRGCGVVCARNSSRWRSRVALVAQSRLGVEGCVAGRERQRRWSKWGREGWELETGMSLMRLLIQSRGRGVGLLFGVATRNRKRGTRVGMAVAYYQPLPTSEKPTLPPS